MKDWKRPPRPRSVALDRLLVAALLDLGQNSAPREACGLLAGHRCDQNGLIRVDRLIATRNEAEGEMAFRIPHWDAARAEMAALRTGHRIVGVFHSHPRSAPELSYEDLEAAFRFGPGRCDLIDLIAGRGGHDGWRLGAWIIEKGVGRSLALCPDGEHQAGSES